MKIEQFEDKGLSHYSYAILSEAFVFDEGKEIMDIINPYQFSKQQMNYIIVDIRSTGEVIQRPAFENAINIPLPELRPRALEIPYDKPIIVHCAGGYRSAAGSSIIRNAFGNKIKVYDLGGPIKAFLQL